MKISTCSRCCGNCTNYMHLPRRHHPKQASSRASQLPRILLRIDYAAGVLLGLIILGTLGFHWAGGDKANLSDAIYMTPITVTTVGYGEVVPIDGFAERLFAGLIALAGFGAISTTLC